MQNFPAKKEDINHVFYAPNKQKIRTFQRPWHDQGLLQICDRILDSSLNYTDHTHDDERLLERSYYFNDICKERLLDLYVVA